MRSTLIINDHISTPVCSRYVRDDRCNKLLKACRRKMCVLPPSFLPIPFSRAGGIGGSCLKRERAPRRDLQLDKCSRATQTPQMQSALSRASQKRQRPSDHCTFSSGLRLSASKSAAAAHLHFRHHRALSVISLGAELWTSTSRLCCSKANQALLMNFHIGSA